MGKPQLSVNGRLNPVVKMRPGEVQLWRIVNGAFRDAVQLQGFAPQGGLAWRQIAQDGVQFAYAELQHHGRHKPHHQSGAGQPRRSAGEGPGPARPVHAHRTAERGPALDPTAGFEPEPPITLLTVSVEGSAVSPTQDFIQNEADFPTFPAYLADIPESDIHIRREVDFGAAHNKIDGKSFDQETYSQVMRLNSAEEWKISNEANDKSHPFHIHVNPFQITEVFEPNAENTSDRDKPCYVDRLNPQTWKPCTPLTAPYAWWDTFAIPTSKQYDVTTECNSDVNQCPAAIRPYVQCKTAKDQTIT